MERRDPITVLKENMEAVKMLTDSEFETMETTVDQKLEKAMEFSEASPEPSAEDVDTDVFAPSKFTAADIEAEPELRQSDRGAIRTCARSPMPRRWSKPCAKK